MDFNSHALKNVVLEPDTELVDVVVKNGVIENSILRNVTAVGLNLGDVAVETVSVNNFANSFGSYVKVTNDGKLEASSSMKSNGGQLLIGEDVSMSKSLQVETDLLVSGEANVEGSLAVAGSVLGGGPYVDISDKRFKREIQGMNSTEVLDRLIQLKGVSYELDTEQMTFLRDSKERAKTGRQIGFVAQDIETLFPELVYNDEENDFKGLHYSRFVPLLVEGIKHLTQEVSELKELNQQYLQAIKDKE